MPDERRNSRILLIIDDAVCPVMDEPENKWLTDLSSEKLDEELNSGRRSSREISLFAV